MDWARAIEINHSALSRIVAGLAALVGLAAGGMVERLPRLLYREALRILRPAESAVRRLIVIAARGLEAKPHVPRPMPAGLKLTGKGKGRAPRFQLFDPRKRFDFNRPRYLKPGQGPRITFFVDDPRAPPFRGPVLKTIEINPLRQPAETVLAIRLSRRLAAIRAALEDLPGEARRLVRWQARRARMKQAKFRDPLRLGKPPGYRKTPRAEIDEVLSECHALAAYAVRGDTS